MARIPEQGAPSVENVNDKHSVAQVKLLEAIAACAVDGPESMDPDGAARAARNFAEAYSLIVR